jgi:ParB family chromosome partitioning protein
MFESTGMSVANPRLGRGLAALMGDAPPAAAAAAAGPAQVLPIERLEPGPFQPRTSFHSDTLAELVDSIRARGILQPLLVRPHPARPEQFQIIAGERRWRAAQQAGLHEVPVLLRALTEEGEGFRRLIEEFGLTQEQLGAAVGKSRSHVANAMRLLQLPPAVRVEVQKGTLSAGHARALLGHPDPEQAAKQVIARGLNVRQTEALATDRQTGSTTRQPVEKDPETVALERDLSERLGLTVQISFDGKGGSVTLKYRNLDQLDSLMALLNRG